LLPREAADRVLPGIQMMKRSPHGAVLLAIVALGATAVITQLVMMREMLCAFTGNEMVLGIVLGNWLLLTGLGAWLGRWNARVASPERLLVVCLALLAWLPATQLMLLHRVFHADLFTRGVILSLSQTMWISLLALAPFCLLSGFTLTLATQFLASSQKSVAIGRVYTADCFGSIAGGALFAFVLVHANNHLVVLEWLGLIGLMLVAGLAAVQYRRAWGMIFVLLVLQGAATYWTTLFPETGTWSQSGICLWVRTLFSGNSPYGQVAVDGYEGQPYTYSFYENRLPIIWPYNAEQREEAVHYAMAERPEARRVLLIGGGVSGTAKEILKYGSNEVTYVELDPLIIEAGQRFLPENLDDPRIKVVNTDGRLFVKQTHERFDVVIIDMPDPSTMQINRFFTTEFFGEVKRILTPGGVVSFGLSRYENYISPQLARVLASANATVRQSFTNLLMIPGGRVFFVASDGTLSADFAGQIEKAGVPTKLVNRNYLNAILMPDRLADMQRAVAQSASVNRDFEPILYFYHLRHWMSQFKMQMGWLAVVAALGLVAYLIHLKPVGVAIFSSGFAGSALSVVLLLGFQVLCGSVYRQVGVIVTVFMAGLAAGAWWANRSDGWKCFQVSDYITGINVRFDVNTARHRLGMLACLILVVALVLPDALRWMGKMPVLVMQTGVALLSFVLAMLVGMEFPTATQVKYEGGATTASRLYTADFVGACLGALLASTLLLPLLGVTGTCLVVAVLNLVATMLLFREKS
jgi:spermidine synthase